MLSKIGWYLVTEGRAGDRGGLEERVLVVWNWSRGVIRIVSGLRIWEGIMYSVDPRKWSMIIDAGSGGWSFFLI